MINLSSICGPLEFWSVNHTSKYQKSELKVFKNIKLIGEIFSNWLNDLLGKIVIQDSLILLIIIVNNINVLILIQ